MIHAVFRQDMRTLTRFHKLMIAQNYLFILTGASCLLAASALNAQELLVNGGFENEPEALNPNSPPQEGGFLWLSGNQIPGWTIAPGSMVTMHENPGPWPTITGAYSINTDGEGANGNNANFYQNFATVNGGTYNFSFDWELWQLNAPSTELQVSITDLTTSASVFDVLYNATTVPSEVVQHVSTAFAGDGDIYQLQIQETPQSGFNDNEFIVDNFSVTGSVPDTTTWAAEAFAALGLVGFSAALRRHFGKVARVVC